MEYLISGDQYRFKENVATLANGDTVLCLPEGGAIPLEAGEVESLPSYTDTPYAKSVRNAANLAIRNEQIAD